MNCNWFLIVLVSTSFLITSQCQWQSILSLFVPTTWLFYHESDIVILKSPIGVAPLTPEELSTLSPTAALTSSYMKSGMTLTQVCCMYVMYNGIRYTVNIGYLQWFAYCHTCHACHCYKIFSQQQTEHLLHTWTYL